MPTSRRSSGPCSRITWSSCAVYAHPWRAGDLVIFNNRGLWHTVVGSLLPGDVRVYHQCNLASSEPPLGPGALSP